MTSTHHSSVFLSSEEDPCPPKFCGATIGCMLKGKKTSGVPCAEYAPVNPGGFTPTIVIGFVFTRIVFPITLGDRPNRFVQNLSLITTTGPLPGAPSSDS